MDPKCEFAFETLGTIEVQRGNLVAAVDHFEKAIPLCNTELEMAHLFGLVSLSTKLSKKFSISLLIVTFSYRQQKRSSKFPDNLAIRLFCEQSQLFLCSISFKYCITYLMKCSSVF